MLLAKITFNMIIIKLLVFFYRFVFYLNAKLNVKTDEQIN